jgi:hypothetical protein
VHIEVARRLSRISYENKVSESVAAATRSEKSSSGRKASVTPGGGGSCCRPI